MKTGYLKEILKTTAKVALIAGATYFLAAPFALGVTATLLNTIYAGQIAEAAVLCLGGYAAVKTAVKDISTMKERVEKQKREEHVDEQLEELKKDVKKVTPKKTVYMNTNGKETKIHRNPDQKKTMIRKINPFYWKHTKEHNRAA